MNKAQAATEYLIGLAGVFIIVLIVLGTIYDFPAAISSSTNLESKRFWANAEIGVLSAYSNGSHTQFTIKNNQRESISLNTIAIDDTLYVPLNITFQPLLAGETGIYVVNFSKVGEFSLDINYSLASLNINREFDAAERFYSIGFTAGNFT